MTAIKLFGNRRAVTYKERKIMHIQNVLVPVDFSPASQLAVDFAAAFARTLRAQLTLLHVAESDKSGKPDADAKSQLSKMLPLAGTEDLNVQTRLRTGNVEDEICVAVEDESADIVVMGTHHHGLIRRLLAGSVAEDMLRKMPVPLLTLSSFAHPRPLTRILFATDLTDSHLEGFRFALELARALGAILIVHYSIEPIPVSYGGFIPVIDDPTDKKLLAEHARHKLSELESEGARERVVVISEVTEGVASEKILAASEELECGLIVLTIHDKGLLERALLGSTAERIVRNSRVPVLSLPVKDAPTPIGDKVHPEVLRILPTEAAE
jgi:nucleotide-binding universal stress UspA family protein